MYVCQREQIAYPFTIPVMRPDYPGKARSLVIDAQATAENGLTSEE